MAANPDTTMLYRDVYGNNPYWFTVVPIFFGICGIVKSITGFINYTDISGNSRKQRSGMRKDASILKIIVYIFLEDSREVHLQESLDDIIPSNLAGNKQLQSDYFKT